uniref:sensor histidine kinase n=1 Tax=Pseudonocardia pini TaxID=2758030 RepID=UPI001FE81C28
MGRVLDLLPRGNTLDDESFARRHRLLCVVLLAHVPVLFGIGMLAGNGAGTTALVLLVPLALALLGYLARGRRRVASSLVTAGLVSCSVILVGLTHGTIESHFHFFVIIGFIALYQDWVPFLWNVVLTVLSHGIGTALASDLIFNHPAAQASPWLWAGVHGIAVFFACTGLVIFWRITEDEQTAREGLGRELLLAEVQHRKFTSDMLVNLARRNQSMLHRQLEIINRLEEEEQDSDALAELFALDHLATRVRRNAESLLVLSGEQTPRLWSAPVPLGDVVRAAIAETEDLDRVEFGVDDRLALSGTCVADLTHLLAELIENAVRYSPPDSVVTVQSRPNRRAGGGQVLTVEDWGIGMPQAQVEEANALLADPREVDVSASQQLGFHVVGRLAARHAVAVSLTTTPGSGITAVVALPRVLFVADREEVPSATPVPTTTARGPLAMVADGRGSTGPGGRPTAVLF